jgi:predicted esterase
VIDRAIATPTHGRYLVEAPSAGAPWPLLVGFHGYAESAEAQLARLRSAAGADLWLLAAVQGLHRFYRGRTGEVVAGWMTRQDRELALADNLVYVAAVVDAIARDGTADGRVVFAGFSQGVAMAFRAAAAAPARGRVAVISLGGDVPPELGPGDLAGISAALVARGARDEWYGRETHEADVGKLRAAGTNVEAFTFDAGHEWTNEFSRVVSDFLRRWR